MQPGKTDGARVEANGSGAITLLSVVAIFVRRWRTVALVTLAGLLLAAAFVALRPRIYAAEVTVVPAQRKGAGNALLAQMPAGLAGLTGGAAPPNEKLITSIMHSRAVRDSIYVRLMGPPRDPADLALFSAQLRRATEIQLTTSGAYSIAVRDRDPVRAAVIANLYPGVINSIAAHLGRQSIELRRQFLEEQLQQARERLVSSEERLLAFQRDAAAPEIQEQARRTVEAASELQTQIMRKEVELAQLRRTSTETNPLVTAARSELAALRAQLGRFTSGNAGGGNVFLPLRESPELKVGSVRMLREFTKDEQVYLALTASLAETQMDVDTNLPVVGVLDSAVTPERPSGVPAPIVIALVTWLAFLAGLGLALLLEYAYRLRRDPSSLVLDEAIGTFRSDWSRVLQRRLQRTP